MNNNPISSGNQPSAQSNMFANSARLQPNQHLANNPFAPPQLSAQNSQNLANNAPIPLNKPRIRPLPIKLTVSIQPPINLLAKKYVNQMNLTDQNGKMVLINTKEDAITQSFKTLIRDKMLSEIWSRQNFIEQFNQFKSQFDLNTPVAKIPLARPQINPKLLNRLKEGFDFYSQPSQRLTVVEKSVVECFIKNKPVQMLFRQIMISLECNAICALYVYCAVMHSQKNCSLNELLNPQHPWHKQLQETSPIMLTKCQQFWFKDRYDLLCFVFERLKATPSSVNLDIFEFKGRQMYLASMLKPFQFCSNDLTTINRFVLEQLVLTVSKAVDIIELLDRKSHSGQLSRSLQQFLSYIKETESKCINNENLAQNLRKLKNKLFKIKIDRLIWQISNQSQPQIHELNFDQYGDFSFIYNWIFCHKQNEYERNPEETQLRLLNNYHGLESIDKIIINQHLYNGIKQKIISFQSSLQKIPQRNANDRLDLLTFLSLHKLICKIQLSNSEISQQQLPNSQQRFSQMFNKRSHLQMKNQIDKAQKKSQVNRIFNNLLIKFLSSRKFAAPIIMLAFLENQNNNFLDIQQTFICKILNSYIQKTKENLSIFYQESFNLQNKLFNLQNLSQIITNDQLYKRCLKNLIQKTIGNIQLGSANSKILDSKNIFINYGNKFVETVPKDGKNEKLDQLIKQVVDLIYKLEQSQQTLHLEKLQDRKKLIEDLLYKEFENSKKLKELEPFYNQCRKNNIGQSCDLVSLIKKLPKRVRPIFKEYLRLKVQNLLLETYLKNDQNTIDRNSNQSMYDFVNKMSNRNIVKFINEIRQYCDNAEKWDEINEGLFLNLSSVREEGETKYLQFQSIKPFNQRLLNDLIDKLWSEKSLNIVYYSDLLKKVWAKIQFKKFIPEEKDTNPATITTQSNPQIIQQNVSLKEIHQFHQNTILALELASDIIHQALIIGDEVRVNFKLYIQMTNYAIIVTSSTNLILRTINGILSFMTHMKSVIQLQKYSQWAKNHNQTHRLRKIRLPIEDASFCRKLKIYQAISTPTFLTAITKYLQIRTTLALFSIKTTKLINQQAGFKPKQIKAYVDTAISVFQSEVEMTQQITQKLILLIGNAIQSQSRSEIQKIYELALLAMFILPNTWNEKTESIEPLLNAIYALNQIPISIQNLIKMFASDTQMLKMVRYGRYLRLNWFNDLKAARDDQIMCFSLKLTPQDAAGFTLKSIQQFVTFTLKHYVNVLSTQMSVKQDHDLWEYLKIKTTDAVFLSSLFSVTMNAIEGLQSYFRRKGIQFSPQQKKECVQTLACSIRLIETFYQKLIQILTFEKIPLQNSDITVSQWNQYKNLIHIILQFQKFIIELQIEHQDDNRFRTITFQKCGNYIAEVMINAQIQAGTQYRKTQIDSFKILEIEPPEFPKQEFFSLLIVDGREKDQKDQQENERSNDEKSRQKNKHHLPLTISKKYNILFE